MAETADPLLQECATCGALIDITDEEPFALMHCPTCGAAMRVRRSFGVFELQEVLGAGGMGAVYRAIDTTLNRPVALKLLRKEFGANPEFIQQFEHEASITAHITHPNVVKVYSTGSDHGLFYIAMELVDKGSLDDLMSLQGRVGEMQILEVGVQIAQGLNAAFQRGLIHRDVKPGNILFADAHHAKIVDFGLAVPLDKAGELGGEIWGTPYYVAPEKLDTPPQEDARSDIYSLGATLFHAVAGRPPYEAEDASMVALKHLKSQPVSLQAFAPDVSSATAYVINRSLHKDPEQRYQRYEEFIEHLEYARTQLIAAANKPRVKTRVILEDEQQQRMMSWVTLGVIITFLIGGIGLFVARDKIFPKRNKTVATTAAQNGAAKPAVDFEKKYEDARQLFIQGKFPEAAKAMRDLAASEPNPPQPQQNWMTVHAGMAAYFAGKPGEAKKDFKALAARGPFSDRPGEEKLAKFFVTMGETCSDSETQPPEAAKDYVREDFEAIGLLLLAAENWALGDITSAGTLFQEFQGAFPEPPDKWISEYKDLAQRYLDALEDVKSYADQVKNATSLARKRGLVDSLKKKAAEPAAQGASADALRGLVRELEKSIAEEEADRERALAELDAADTPAINEARTKAGALAAQFKFLEARGAFRQIDVTGPKSKRIKNALVRKMDWLSMFKSLLVQDLTIVGYAAPLQKKNGAQVPGTVSGGDDTKIDVKSQYGSVPVPWPDVAPETLIRMAQSFIRPNLPADRIADRKWCLGVFLCHLGRTADGEQLMNDAANVKTEYRDALPDFKEFALKP